jgi:aspartate-semialdehyde dehydrogenase
VTEPVDLPARATARLPVAVLGATGMVGQRMIEQLRDHPWIELAAVAASSRSAGRSYGEATTWRLPGSMPPEVAAMPVRVCAPDAMPPGVRVVLSALDADAAREIEGAFRAAGFGVITNASAFRADPDVPLVVPEVNPEHLSLLDGQGPGFILANPNCCAVPLAIALAPLHERWGVEAAVVATWQAVSGAGYPGESAWDMVGNVHPHAGNEEQKLNIEPQKLLGAPGAPADFPVSARCVRVPVADGHLLSVNLRLRGAPPLEAVRAALLGFTGRCPPLPSSPTPLIVHQPGRDRPSPRFDAGAGGGMAITVGRVEACPVMGVKFFVLGHNTVRGAAGAAVANLELLLRLGRLRLPAQA